MRTLSSDFIFKKGIYPSPLKCNKIQVSKEEEIDLNKENKSELFSPH